MSQDHLHQADRDYSAANEPNEEKLMEQLESAMLLADMFQGRRRVDPQRDLHRDEPYPDLKGL